MAPVVLNNGGEIATQNGNPSKCPFSNTNYPPIAPIPALRKKSSKIQRQMSRPNSDMGGLAILPNLPSRCTWQPGSKEPTPHTIDHM